MHQNTHQASLQLLMPSHLDCFAQHTVDRYLANGIAVDAALGKTGTLNFYLKTLIDTLHFYSKKESLTEPGLGAK
jgi:hypothetical protein